MADAIDAKEFVLRAKQLLSLAEYQDFVIALRTLRASCGNENEDTEMINNLMYQVSKVFSAPDRRDLLRNFVVRAGQPDPLPP